ncbi:hypothetical protein M422DRAFT_54175 [Sphaerobolus stellatus SS14]|uniref:Uncharacterized protein n=1 Tax=Sphaerobolus stellatus (strain SS14) TaxID=990650 RepID=A0A0C9UVR0_SPHS4|nr:hypothetical protein M422DRAFT_54175 [Sphaerobolus stellatus SS14]
MHGAHWRHRVPEYLMFDVGLKMTWQQVRVQLLPFLDTAFTTQFPIVCNPKQAFLPTHTMSPESDILSLTGVMPVIPTPHEAAAKTVTPTTPHVGVNASSSPLHLSLPAQSGPTFPTSADNATASGGPCGSPTLRDSGTALQPGLAETLINADPAAAVQIKGGPTLINGATTATTKPEDEPKLVNGVVQWTWEPFVAPTRTGVWQVNPIGVEWLDKRLNDYYLVEGPQGVSILEYEKRLANKRLKFKKDLAEEFMNHFHGYDYKKVLPANPSKKQVRTAKKRVFVKIGNMLADSNKPTKKSKTTDVLDLVYRHVRRSTARDVWARESPDYKDKEADRMIVKGWTLKMDRPKMFPLQMRVRQELWKELPEEDRAKWTQVATEDVRGPATREKFIPTVGPHLPNLSSMSASEVYESAMRKAVGAMTQVGPDEVKVIAPWRPRINVPKPCVAVVYFASKVKVDEQGNIITPEDALRDAITSYLHMTFEALCPASREGKGKGGRLKKPDWDRMVRMGMNKFVDPAVLPPPPFTFNNPQHYLVPQLLEFGGWLLKGESGELPEAQRFRWIGQRDDVTIEVKNLDVDATQPSKPKKAKRQAHTTSQRQDPPVLPLAHVENEVDAKVKKALPAKQVKLKQVDLLSLTKKTRQKRTHDEESEAAPTVKQARRQLPHRRKKTDMNTEDSDEESVSEAYVMRANGSEEYTGGLQTIDRLLFSGPMGSPIPLSARFIEAAEVDTPVMVVGKLDVSAPADNVTDGVGMLIDEILDPMQPLPTASQLLLYPAKQGLIAFDSLYTRAKDVLKTIVEFPTQTMGAIIQVGGSLGLFPGLRALEFIRSYTMTAINDEAKRAKVTEFMEHYDTVLAQEAWRRWATASFALSKHDMAGVLFQSWSVYMETVMRANTSADDWFRMGWRTTNRPPMVEDIAQLAMLRTRSVQPKDLAVPFSETAWRKANMVSVMKEWANEMNELLFRVGSVREKFTWTYAWYMLVAVLPEGEEREWCQGVVAETTEWLQKTAKATEPHILKLRKDVLMVSGKRKGQRKGKGKAGEVYVESQMAELVILKGGETEPSGLGEGMEGQLKSADTPVPHPEVVLSAPNDATVNVDGSNVSIVEETETVIRTTRKPKSGKGGGQTAPTFPKDFVSTDMFHPDCKYYYDIEEYMLTSAEKIKCHTNAVALQILRLYEELGIPDIIFKVDVLQVPRYLWRATGSTDSRPPVLLVYPGPAADIMPLVFLVCATGFAPVLLTGSALYRS